MSRYLSISVLTIMVLLLGSQTAKAACTNPAASEGAIVYNSSFNVFQYCKVSTWKALHAPVSTSDGDCTNPSRSEGGVLYDGDENVPRVCAGGVWLALGLPNPGAGSGGCSNPAGAEGVIVYNNDYDVLQYCDGAAWKQVYGQNEAPDCPFVGDVCKDGSVYAGLSPAGNVRMFVARCDIGMSWDGSNCVGTHDTHPWNDGNPDFTNTSLVDYPVAAGADPDGKANTAILITEDSNSVAAGQQLHVAAQDCADLNVHGSTDWYLPSAPELDVIYENLVDGTPNDDSPDPLVSGFDITGAYYRSSTEHSTNRALNQRFTDGNVSNPSKPDNHVVRCARR